MAASNLINELSKATDQAATWIKRIAALALLLIVSAMLVEAAAKLLGFSINLRAPGWDQGTALTIAALAYALGRS